MLYYIEVLKKYAVFEGRARRLEYWMFMLVNTLIMMILVIPIIASLYGRQIGIISDVFLFINIIYYFALLIPSIAVTVRRLHDTGRSGAWYFISLIPYIGAVWLFVLMVLDSDSKENQYGLNPKEEMI